MIFGFWKLNFDCYKKKRVDCCKKTMDSFENELFQRDFVKIMLARDINLL